jgi:hypothetical protein
LSNNSTDLLKRIATPQILSTSFVPQVPFSAHARNQLRKAGLVTSVRKLIGNNASIRRHVHRHHDAGDMRRDEGLRGGFAIAPGLRMFAAHEAREQISTPQAIGYRTAIVGRFSGDPPFRTLEFAE